MLRLVLFSMLFLAGCSELKIIGSAAVRELQADAISVEWLAYNRKPDPAFQGAPAADKGVPPGATRAKVAISRKSGKKGLWEGANRVTYYASR